MCDLEVENCSRARACLAACIAVMQVPWERRVVRERRKRLAGRVRRVRKGEKKVLEEKWECVCGGRVLQGKQGLAVCLRFRTPAAAAGRREMPGSCCGF